MQILPLTELAQAAIDLIYPPFCVHCRVGIAHGWLCEKCAGTARKIVAPRCEICSRPYEGAISQTFSCPNCEESNFAFRCAVAAYRAKGVVRELIHRLKYSGHFYLRRLLSIWLAETLTDPRIVAESYDVFVPVPLHPVRRRERGYDQVEALAERISVYSGKPWARALKRSRYTETQTRFDRRARLHNLHQAFAPRDVRAITGKRIILIDDVLTTGTTLDECSRVLLAAGAASVRAITVARG